MVAFLQVGHNQNNAGVRQGHHRSYVSSPLSKQRIFCCQNEATSVDHILDLHSSGIPGFQRAAAHCYRSGRPDRPTTDCSTKYDRLGGVLHPCGIAVVCCAYLCSCLATVLVVRLSTLRGNYTYPDFVYKKKKTTTLLFASSCCAPHVPQQFFVHFLFACSGKRSTILMTPLTFVLLTGSRLLPAPQEKGYHKNYPSTLPSLAGVYHVEGIQVSSPR